MPKHLKCSSLFHSMTQTLHISISSGTESNQQVYELFRPTKLLQFRRVISSECKDGSVADGVMNLNKTKLRKPDGGEQALNLLCPPKCATGVKFVHHAHHDNIGDGFAEHQKKHVPCNTAAYYRPQSEAKMEYMTALFFLLFFCSLMKARQHVSTANGGIAAFGKRFLFFLKRERLLLILCVLFGALLKYISVKVTVIQHSILSM